MSTPRLDPAHPFQDPRKDASILLLCAAIPVIIQGSLLHPKFASWRILRWVRVAMTPLNVYLGLKGPLDYAFKPSHMTGGFNFCLAIWGLQVAMKSLQFGLTAGYMEGRFWVRTDAVLSENDKAYTPESDYNREYSWLEILRWSIKQVSSPRGIQYGWGQKCEFNTRTVWDVAIRLFKMHLLSLMATAGCVLWRDLGSPTNVLLALGFPNSMATTILAEGLASLSFPAFLLSWFDLAYCWITLGVYLMSWIGEQLQLPGWIMEWLDVRLYPVIFHSPHSAKSLNELWSNGWHQFLRADLIFFGARPAMSIARRLNLSKTGQKICSAAAVFFLSGILHELYILSTVAGKTSLREYLSQYPFPGALWYFMVQPVGIILEPMIIPRIPKILGGGTLWVWMFSLAVIIPYRNVLLGEFGMLDRAVRPLADWPIYTLFMPGSLYRVLDWPLPIIDRFTLSDLASLIRFN